KRGLQRRCDDEREEDRRDERDEQLTRPPGGELEAPPRERRERPPWIHPHGGTRNRQLLSDSRHRSLLCSFVRAGRQATAGPAQVDVVEGRWPRRDGGRP